MCTHTREGIHQNMLDNESGDELFGSDIHIRRKHLCADDGSGESDQHSDKLRIVLLLLSVSHIHSHLSLNIDSIANTHLHQQFGVIQCLQNEELQPEIISLYFRHHLHTHMRILFDCIIENNIRRWVRDEEKWCRGCHVDRVIINYWDTLWNQFWSVLIHFWCMRI